MDVITSKNNEDVKYLRKLYKTRQRKKESKFILEGIRIIREAFEAGVNIEKIFLIPELQDNKSNEDLLKENKVRYVQESLLYQIASTVNPQGIIAIVDKPDFNFEKIDSKKCILVLDRIQDPGNMGTLIRTASAAGMEGIIALKGCVDIYNLKVLKATMGAIFDIPIITRMGMEDFLHKYQESDFNLYVTDIKAAHNYCETNYIEPLFMVIGNEGEGISEEILKAADFRIKIPTFGNIDSLNAAISGGIVMFEYVSKNILHSGSEQ